jgi:Co/Zn/Cd efflux system component
LEDETTKQFSSQGEKPKLGQAEQQQKGGLKYYDRSRKPSFNAKVRNGYVQKCALEHDRKFQKKIAEANRAMKKLFFVSFICFIFMGLEFAGGIISHSLAILTDAAHMFSDVAGFMISFFSIYISKNSSTFAYSMGYHRAEILGAFVSIFLIWGLLGWLNYEATRRLRDPGPEIDPDIMLITACIGFACNVTNFCALNANCGSKKGEEEEDRPLYKSSILHQSLSN